LTITIGIGRAPDLDNTVRGVADGDWLARVPTISETMARLRSAE
jgi:hypothetical protein